MCGARGDATEPQAQKRRFYESAQSREFADRVEFVHLGFDLRRSLCSLEPGRPVEEGADALRVRLPQPPPPPQQIHGGRAGQKKARRSAYLAAKRISLEELDLGPCSSCWSL
jgi:hypothetical protein